MLILALFVTVLVVEILRRWWHSTQWDHIPGNKSYTSLPLLGHIGKLGAKPLDVLMEHHQKYGDIFRLDVGKFPTVWLCNYEDISFAWRSKVFVDRVYPHYKVIAMGRGVDSKGNYPGITFSNGPAWEEQRKFFKEEMVNLGMGKSTGVLPDIISQEQDVFAEILADRARNNPNNEVDMNMCFHELTGNVGMRLITGRPHRQDDADIFRLTYLVRDLFHKMERGTMLETLQLNSTLVAWLSYVFGIRSFADVSKPLMSFAKEAAGVGEENAEAGNLVDRYLARIAKAQPGSSFYRDDGHSHMCGAIFDMYIGAIDTFSTFMEWAVYYLVMYPWLQDKLFEEIDRVFGQRKVNLGERHKTPYVEAAIQELMRHSPHMGLTSSRMSAKEIVVGGIRIPKNTQVYAFHTAPHMNKAKYGDPEVFRPDRYLDDNGAFVPDYELLYFGFGQRRCPAELMSKMEQFVILASTVQRFKFGCPDNKDEGPQKGYLAGLNMHPKPYKAKITPRF